MSRESSVLERDAREAPEAAVNAGPLGWLPRVSRRQLGLEQRLERWTRLGSLPRYLQWLEREMGVKAVVDRPEILGRASGLGRSALVAQISHSRLATRLAIGIETPLAHAIVDRMLGFDRPLAQSRNQLTPVEWGVWTFLFVRALASLDDDGRSDPQPNAESSGHLRPADLSLDRVSPDPFDATGLGAIVTIRWPVRVGEVAGSVRLWLPDAIINQWLAAPLVSSPRNAPGDLSIDVADGSHERHRRLARAELAGSWHAEAGFINMSSGLKRLRKGGVLPLSDSRLTGTPASPQGRVALILDIDSQNLRFEIPVQPVADSGGRLVRLETGLSFEPLPRDPIDSTSSETQPMSQPNAPAATTPSAGPLDVPVTLTVELGRVNLTLAQLADLKPGDVVELNRHSRAPIELTSNGRLVARGELILIDTDLGVRVTNVFL